MDPLSGWEIDAACRNMGAATFYGSENKKQGAATRIEELAKTVCRRCPVREECLQHALDNGEVFGIWGGLTAQERHGYVRRARPTPGRIPLARIAYTTNARSTGARCSAGATATGWGVYCHTHHHTADTRNRTIAGYAASRPEEWCPDCARIAKV